MLFYEIPAISGRINSNFLKIHKLFNSMNQEVKVDARYHNFLNFQISNLKYSKVFIYH